MLMREFLPLLGQLFLIAVLQSIMSFFVNSEKPTYMLQLINIACYLGSLYIILQFVYTYLLSQVMNMFNF